MRAFSLIRRALILIVVLVLAASAAAILISFPWNTDPQGDESSSTRAYYQKAYGDASKTQSTSAETPALSEQEQYYINIARQSAIGEKIPEEVDAFVARANLKGKKVLEVGAGSGLLQDAVDDYTGLDISTTARRFFHKPFVEASATDMPFPDNTFDGLWSIWVLEHIPNPEKALQEIRRVVKPGGWLLLHPAFEVSSYAAQGYKVRPYGDFDWAGKLVKATMPIRMSETYHYLQYHQIHLLRTIGTMWGGPSRLHFMRLTPNYEKYWVPDSDATTSLSLPELQRWFTTRGDRCVECAPEPPGVLHDSPNAYLMIQVVK